MSVHLRKKCILCSTALQLELFTKSPIKWNLNECRQGLGYLVHLFLFHFFVNETLAQKQPNDPPLFKPSLKNSCLFSCLLASESGRQFCPMRAVPRWVSRSEGHPHSKNRGRCSGPGLRDLHPSLQDPELLFAYVCGVCLSPSNRMGNLPP